MIRLGMLFLVVAFVAALMGFGWVADLSYPAARVVCFTCLALAAATVLTGLVERGKIQDAW